MILGLITKPIGAIMDIVVLLVLAVYYNFSSSA